jgi:hypothetical protein
MKILKSYCNIYSLNGAKGISIIDYIVYPVHPARYNYIVLLCNRAWFHSISPENALPLITPRFRLYVPAGYTPPV